MDIIPEDPLNKPRPSSSSQLPVANPTPTTTVPSQTPTSTPLPSGPAQPRKPDPRPTTFQPPPSNDPAHDLKRYQEAEHPEKASPEDITPQQLNMVTRDSVVYLHPIAYDTTPTATRHRHPVYAHVPQRRSSSGPVFQSAELSKHPQMNRVFPYDSDPSSTHPS